MPLTGIQEGGWEFVQAAYTVSAVVLIAYVASLFRRAISERAL